MPIKPPIYKLSCPLCGYSKLVEIKSDLLCSEDLQALSTTCPKCGETMQRVPLGLIEQLIIKLKP